MPETGGGWGAQQAEELWDEVTTRARDDVDGFTDRRKATVVEKVLAKLVEMVFAGQDEFITRPMVENQLGEQKVNRNQWTQVDERLRAAPFMYKIEVTTGPQNMILYRKA